MPEKRMGHIAKYERDLKKKDPNARLRVEFVLASDPNTKYYGTVVENGIHDRAEVRSDLGSASTASSTGLNTVLIKVALDDRESLPPKLQLGTECAARIDCGKQPVGYVLFHEAVAFVQKNIIFRWF